MLEPTVKELVNHLHNHFPSNQSYSKTQLDSAREMPGPIAHYITQQITQRTAKHLGEIANDPWIDSTKPAVRQELETLEHTLEKAACIPAEQWSEVVSNASKEVVRYLVDPVNELADFVFRERSSLPITEVRRRMSHFSPYSYLHSVFTAYADRKSLETIDHERFKEVLGRIDRQMVADYTADKWERLFQPLYHVLGVLSPSAEEARVRVELVRQLAASKRFDALVHQLDHTSSSHLSLADTHQLIGAALNRSSAAAERSEQAEPQQQPQQREMDQPQPRWKQFQQGNTVRSSRATSSPPPRPQPQRSSPDGSGQPLWQQFQRPNQSTANQPSKKSPSNTPTAPSSASPSHASPKASSGSLDALERDVIGVIPGDQRERFVRRLFSGSQQEYADILAELQNVSSWKEASSLIAKKVFLPHQVNIYSEPAVTFTDLVEAQFQQTSVRR